MFILTGFGEFGKIIHNPTSFLIEELTEDEKKQYNIIHAEILEVSMGAVKDFYNKICDKIDSKTQNQRTKIIVIHNGI